jgi:hypothetical protein
MEHTKAVRAGASGAAFGKPSAARRWIATAMLLLSTALGLVAFGRQKAWAEPLKGWLCDFDAMPRMPGIFLSALSAGVVEWLLALVVPLLLAAIFLGASRAKLSLLFWLPLLTLHVVNRFGALHASTQHWGFCGLKRDGVFNAVVLDIGLLLVAVGGGVASAVIAFVRSRWTSAGARG